jgi:hypothetical protein
MDPTEDEAFEYQEIDIDDVQPCELCGSYEGWIAPADMFGNGLKLHCKTCDPPKHGLTRR